MMTSDYIYRLLPILALVVPLQGDIVTTCGFDEGYGVVIDVGSSGSRVRVYRWPVRQEDDDIPAIMQVYSYKKKPGFSTLSHDMSGVEPYVIDLLNEAKENVPSHLHSSTSLYFLATAGMRLLTEDNSNSLMDAANDIFSDTGVNPFQYSSLNTRVLSGEEEGAFAWIALNYLRGYFTGEVEDDAGVMELGGASTQIAFVPEGSPLANKFPVTIGGVEYPLYVHSYLYYGQEYSFIWSVQHLVMEQPDQTTIDHPCLLTGDVKYQIVNDVNITLRGTGDPDGCKQIINAYIYQVDPIRCFPKPCAIGPFYQPSIPESMMFYAMAAFSYPIDAYGISNEDNIVSPQEFINGAYNYCRTSIDEADRTVDQDREFLSANCQDGIFSGVLFTKAYGFEANTTLIKVVSEINGEDVNWAVGNILYELGRSPVTCSSISIAYSTSALTLLLLLIQLIRDLA